MGYSEEKINEVLKYLRSVRDEVVSLAGSIDTEEKEDQSLVTKMDREVESNIRRILLDGSHGVGIYGEEFGIEGDQTTVWTIDPIDGTEQFARGNPYYTAMIAYVEKDVPKSALIYNYATDEAYICIDNQQSTKNGTPIHVSTRQKSRAMYQVETDMDLASGRTLLIKLSDLFFARHHYGACAGYGFIKVAEGKYEARIQIDGYGKIYDFLPGQIIVRGAGGAVFTPGLEEWDWHRLDSVASNQVIAKAVEAAVLSSKA